MAELSNPLLRFLLSSISQQRASDRPVNTMGVGIASGMQRAASGVKGIVNAKAAANAQAAIKAMSKTGKLKKIKKDKDKDKLSSPQDEYALPDYTGTGYEEEEPLPE